MAVAYSSVGLDVSGRPALLAPTAATWWRQFVVLVKLVLDLDLEIIQAKGTYSGSGGTHADGWCIDLRTWRFNQSQILAIVALARQYGGSATWYRTTVGSGPHIHLTVDAGDQATASRYQTRAVRAGYNGLGYLGRGGPDPHPAPATWRTADQGIPLMQFKIGDLAMSLTAADATRVVVALLGQKLGRSGPNVGTAIQTTHNKAHTAQDSTVHLLGQMLGRSGPAVGTAIQTTHNRVGAIEQQISELTPLLARMADALDALTSRVDQLTAAQHLDQGQEVAQ